MSINWIVKSIDFIIKDRFERGVLMKQHTVCILLYTEDGKFLFEDGKLGDFII